MYSRFATSHLYSVFFLLIVASAAAEATGSEETAADYSAMESFGPNEDQQVHITFELWQTSNRSIGKAQFRDLCCRNRSVRAELDACV